MTNADNRYELLQRIGVGGMAEVFRARMVGPAGFQKVVALKRILEDLSSDRDFIHRFVDEARLTAKLQHPNICQVLDFGVLDDRYYLTLEYVRGLDLAQLLKRLDTEKERLPPELCLVIISGVLRGLHFAHEAVDEQGTRLGLVHRDVSPQNVLLSVNGDIKLSDFGAAKANASVRSARTKDNIALGKLAYMAPEQRMGRPVDARTDLFTAAVLLAEMLLGPTTFRRATGLSGAERERLAGAADDRFPPLVSSRIATVLSRALDKKPERRYSDGASMLTDIEECLVELSVPVSSSALGELVRYHMEESAKEVAQNQLESVRPDAPSPFSIQNPFDNTGTSDLLRVPLESETNSSLPDVNDLGLATAPTELAESVENRQVEEELETSVVRGPTPALPQQPSVLTTSKRPGFDDLQTQVVSSSDNMEEFATQIHRGSHSLSPPDRAAPAVASPPETPQPAALPGPAVDPSPAQPSVQSPPRAASAIGPSPPASVEAAQAAPPPAFVVPSEEPPLSAATWTTQDDGSNSAPGLDASATAPDAAPSYDWTDKTVPDAASQGDVKALANASRKQVTNAVKATKSGGGGLDYGSRRSTRVRLVVFALIVLLVIAIAGFALVAQWRAARDASPFPLESNETTETSEIPLSLIGATPVDASPADASVVIADATPATVIVESPPPDTADSPAPRRQSKARRVRRQPRRDSRVTPAPQQNSRGRAQLSILADPPGRAYVDGRLVGHRTPVRGVRLSPGVHQVRVVFSSTRQAQSRRITLDPGEHEVVRFSAR